MLLADHELNDPVLDACTYLERHHPEEAALLARLYREHRYRQAERMPHHDCNATYLYPNGPPWLIQSTSMGVVVAAKGDLGQRLRVAAKALFTGAADGHAKEI